MRSKLAMGALAALALALPAAAGAATPDGFTSPSFVDSTLAGGEPLVLDDQFHHDLIYTSHEGTTHLYRPGFTSLLPVAFNYRNQVNMWTSDDAGASWRRVSFPAGFQTNPAQNTGFSDPDLTQDEAGRVYNTGIDLVNDSLFSSNDGGKNWDKGTANCHNGDRPWLAGAKKDQVFMATDAAEGSGNGHTIFESTDGGNTCSATGVSDAGKTATGQSYNGYGKLYYDHHNGKLVEPVLFFDDQGNANAIGTSVWKPGDTTIKPVKATDTTVFGHFPIVTFDNADNLYLVWDTNDRVKNTSGGCTDNPAVTTPSPAPNHIMMAVSKDFGQTWSAPVAIASPADARVLWPWAVAGDPGKLSIVWYQTSKVVDPDCQDSDVRIYEARVDNATDPATRSVAIVNASGRPIHQGSVCQGGTDCVATGKDRRLGDFFTNSIDSRGCIDIASGDTTVRDPNTQGPMASSLPIFLRQNAGTALVGNGDCANGVTPASAPAGPTSAGRPTCRDTTPPKSTLKLPKGYARRGSRVRLRGRSSDAGCKTANGLFAARGKVMAVFVTLQKVGRHNCAFVNKKGHVGKARNCHRVPKSDLLRAHGTTRWTFGIKLHVPPGNYRAVVRAIDTFGNKETPSARRDIIRFRLPRL
jgi:hypothetical protein